MTKKFSQKTIVKVFLWTSQNQVFFLHSIESNENAMSFSVFLLTT